VVKVLKPGTYKLANEDGEELTNTWNIQQLRRFYPYQGCPSICCRLHTQHPSWQYRCKYQQINKVKGQLGSPQKTKSPSGATTGASPEKWSHFFAKICKCANYAST
jgi:hypothetical protein